LDSLGCLEPGCDSLDNPPVPDEMTNPLAVSRYPNPVINPAYIRINTDILSLDNEDYIKFETYDIVGRLLGEFTSDKYNWFREVNNIRINYQNKTTAPGVYLLKVKTATQTIAVIKFVTK